MSDTFREMFPPIQPYDTGLLRVSDLHQIYYEQSGNKNGKPVLFIHGGPGSGCKERDRQFFDPSVYRIILSDQRGAGKSLPPGELKENTSQDLVGDMEKLRGHLGIDSWLVFGGSWGSTLALLYAEAHPEFVKALILRGIFLGTSKEYSWTDVHGLNMLFPDAWETYLSPIPEEERNDINAAYLKRLTGEDTDIQQKCLSARKHWATVTSQINVDPQLLEDPELDIKAAKIEYHYSMNGSFLKTDDQILANIDRIRHIPTVIVQGRYDIICPMEGAWLLHKAFPEAELYIIPASGHSSKEPGIQTKLLDVTDKFKIL